MLRGKRHTRIGLALGLATVCGLFNGTELLAQKKPGGGGGGTVPPGLIYFQEGGRDTARSMKADGSGKADSITGEPTYQLHDGVRWFLTSAVTGADPDGNEYMELFAVADNGDTVPLNLEAVEFLGGRWGKDDSFLSYVAIHDTDGVRSAGLFVARIDWSLGSPVIDTPEKVLHVNLYDDCYPDVYFYDWSPLGDEVVYMFEEYDTNNDRIFSLKVSKFLAGGTTETRTVRNTALYPQWSPNGSRIAFKNLVDGAIWTMLPDGTGAVKVSNRKSDQSHFEPCWSPASEHLIFTQSTRKQKGFDWPTYTYDIVRIAAAGGGPTNLTADTAASCFGIAWR